VIVAVASALRANLARRGWPIARDPGRLVGYVLAVDALAIGWAIVAMAHLHAAPRTWAVLGLMVGLALIFEEGARRVGRLQFRMSADLKRDMTSVWSVAAAVALTPGLAVLLHVTVLGYLWFRQERPAGEIFYRKFCSSCTAVLGCLGANAVMHAGASVWTSLPWMLAGAVSVLVVIVVHTCINRSLVTGALLILGVRGKELLGSQDDNLGELATLCLGGLVALAALHEPWLCVLVLAPMVTLQRGALVRELETAASTDSKTGLLNAIAWEHLATRELARAARNKYELAVLLIDIDRFKLVNDRFGHLAGDVVLRGVGRCLEAGVREFDAVGRFGGEEFVVVLPEATDVEALIVAERLRSRVNDLRVSAMVDGVDSFDDQDMSVSIGVASSPTDGVELADLLMAADGALYAAKASGRNCVVLADRGSGNAFERVTHS
jgi:diguanylate cyclase (GGDEF)-like protein